MKNELKIRDIQNERRYFFVWNFIGVFIILAVAALVSINQGSSIGLRNMVFLYILDGFFTLSFMIFLEKYTLIYDVKENIVISVLSSFYTCVIMTIINAIFFMTKSKFIADITVAFVKIASLITIDILFKKIINNGKKYRKARLLILNSEKNNDRMQRIKYGIINNYDSWYGSRENICKEKINQVMSDFDAVCVLDDLTDEEYSIVVSAAIKQDKDFFIVPKILDIGKTNAAFVRFDDILALYIPKQSLTYDEIVIKRIVDIILAFIGLVAAFVPMAVIAAAIKLTSEGPVFYKQTRLTKNKKEFEIYKFRTMVNNAEKISGPKFAEKNDPRITKVGKVLRACRMDELPQLINILKGDMSVVGPRPERPVFVEQFEKKIENYDYRFKVKAGLTSLSHVYGRYSTHIHDRTYYDLFYITHYSLLLDIKIILLTTKTIFLKGAAEGEDGSKEKTVIKNYEKGNLNEAIVQ